MKKDEYLSMRDVNLAEALACYLLRRLWYFMDKSAVARERLRNIGQELSDALHPMAQATRSTTEFVRMFTNRFEIQAMGRDYDGRGGLPITVPVPRRFLPEGIPEVKESNFTSDTVAAVRFDLLAKAIRFDALRVAIHKSGQAIAAFVLSPPLEGEEDQFRVDEGDVSTAHSPGAMPENLHHTKEWVSTWTALAPLSHGADMKTGNVAMFRRHLTVDPRDGRLKLVPFYAGNAVRGGFRDLLFGNMLEMIGVKSDQIAPEMAHALLAGGNIDKGADGAGVDLAARRRARACPAWDLMAGCIHQQIMKSVLRCADAVLVCRENAWILYDLMQPGVPFDEFEAGLKPSDDLLYLRLETRMAHRDLEGSEGSQMIVNIEHAIDGAQFVHRLSVAALDGVSPITVSALAHLLSVFHESPFIGAKNAHGFGQLAMTPYSPRGGAGPLPSPDLYRAWVAEHAEELRSWLGFQADRVQTSMAAASAQAGQGAEGGAPTKGKKGGGRGGAKTQEAAGPSLFGAEGGAAG